MDGQDVDNLIDDVITKINRLFKIYTQDDRPNYKLQSLNATKRKEELNRIINENDSLYHRLMNQKSCYPNKQMKKDWKYHQDLFARISKYPNTGKNHGKVNKKLTLPPIQTRSAEINTSCKPNNCIGNRLVKKP